MTLSEHIKQKRKKNGLSQVELAERSGVGLRFVRDLEHSQCLFSGNPFHLEINELETSKTSLAQKLFHCILFYHLLVELLLCVISDRLYT